MRKQFIYYEMRMCERVCVRMDGEKNKKWHNYVNGYISIYV